MQMDGGQIDFAGFDNYSSSQQQQQQQQANGNPSSGIGLS